MQKPHNQYTKEVSWGMRWLCRLVRSWISPISLLHVYLETARRQPALQQREGPIVRAIGYLLTLHRAWRAYKYINPKEPGAVLPIVQVNGFKRTIYSCMDDQQPTALFTRYGY